MNTEEQLLNDDILVSISEVATSSGLSVQDISELTELGVFEPRAREPIWMFPAQCIDLARSAHRLQVDFDLSLRGVALALSYRQRIRELEEKLHRLECELPGRAAHD